jgi:rhombotail lipoprotein
LISVRRSLRAGLALSISTTVTGCALIPSSEHHRSSSVVSFLFPDGEQNLQEPGLPVLRLPLRVGIAFVPDENSLTADFSEAKKQTLLERTAGEFRSLPFVESIQTVPELYLRPRGGFTNLDQLRRLLGIDVVVLLSYDQAQFTDQNRRSLAYWTIVGAYFINGNQNDTHTLMEATVYDIPSRTLLFHAPGTDLTRATSSLANVDRELREDRVGSLDRATADLVIHLHEELAVFRAALKAGRSDIKIEHKPGYAGGGAWHGAAVLAGGLLLVGAHLLAKRRAART